MCWIDEKLYSGGLDKCIKIFDSELNELSKISVDSQICSLDVMGDSILTGLKNGSICLVSENEKEVINYLMKSHYKGEVWGLDITENQKVVTTGDDNQLMVWCPTYRKNQPYRNSVA